MSRVYYIPKENLKILRANAQRIGAQIQSVESIEMDYVKVVVKFKEND